MKFGIEVKKNKLNIHWENLKADFYKIFIKINGVFCEIACVSDTTFTTLSMLPVGDNECYIVAIKDGVVISKTPIMYFTTDTIDAVCFSTQDGKVSVLSSSQDGADGYRLYKSVDNGVFSGTQNFTQNGGTFTLEQSAKYKLKPYKNLNGERNVISSSDVVSLDDNVFEKLSLYKSYNEKLFLSWIYKGRADGFEVYMQGLELPVFSTSDGLCHWAYLEKFKDDSEFYVKAFLNTPNGKVFIAQSQNVSLTERIFDNPTVSLIIPAYNAQNYIARSIDSALASDFNDLELVIVNDGSSDSTQQVIDWYSENYPNVVSIQKENGGVADTRNVGIAAAKGKYIAFMDNDDLLRPNMIKTLYDSIVKNDCDVAIAPLYRLVDKGYTTHCQLPFEEDKSINIDEYFKIMYTPGYYNCAIWNKLYKADLVKAHPLGLLKYEDVSWTPCILSYAKNFCFINTPFYEWDRKSRPETFGDVLSKMPEEDLFEHRKQAMMFFVENGNPEKLSTMKTIAIRRLRRYAKNSTHTGYNELIAKLS